MVVLLITASLEGQHLAKSFFNTGLLGAAGTDAAPSDDQFNLVSFLSHFEGSNNGVNNAFDDGSASNHTITANGNVTQGSFGPFARPDGEWGVDFDGDGDYLSVPYSTDFNFGTGSFTVEAFVFLRDLSGSQGIYSTSGGEGGTTKFIIYLDGATPKAHINGFGSSLFLNATATISANEWNHLAFVRNGSTWYWFVNGTQAGTGSNSTNITFSNVATVVGYGGESGNTPINGFISNIRVVNGTALYTSNFTVPTSALTAITNTKLLTCQSNRFIDNSASAHTLTPAGNPAVSAFGPILTKKVYNPAVNGGSAYFDGNGDYLSFPDSADWDFGTGDFTVEGWVNPASDLASDTQFIGFGDGDNGGNFGFEATGKPYFYHGGYYARTNTALKLGSWSYIAFVRSSGTLSCYINGTSAASSSYTGNVGGSLAPRVGAYSGGQYFKGYMQDVRILKGTAVYTSNFTPPTAPLTAITNTKLLLNMADGQAIDSAAQNNLTLYGTAKTSTGQAKFGNTSLLLDGNSDYAIFPNGATGGAGDWTIEMFIFSSNVGSGEFGTLLDNRPDSTNGLYQTLVLAAATLKFYVGGSGASYRITSDDSLSANTWYHVAVCKSGSSTKMFIDGTQTGSTFTDNVTYINTGRTLIGAEVSFGSGIDEFFNGYIDEFRISNMARYTSNFTAPAEPFADKGQ